MASNTSASTPNAAMAVWRAYEIASLRFEQGVSPADIAKRYKLNPASVSRILKRMESQVESQVRLPDDGQRDAKLESELKRLYRLSDSVVVVVPEAYSGKAEFDLALDDKLQVRLGASAAQFLRDVAQTDNVIGVGMGRTVQSAIQYLRRNKIMLADRLTLFALAGGTAVYAIDEKAETIVSANANASFMARTARHADVIQLSGPGYKKSTADARTFTWTADDRGPVSPHLALLGIGTVAKGFPHCFEALRHELPPAGIAWAEELERKVDLVCASLKAAEETLDEVLYFPVGDILSRPFAIPAPAVLGEIKCATRGGDLDMPVGGGTPISSVVKELSDLAESLNSLAVAAKPTDLRKIESIIIAAGGARKAFAIRHALKTVLDIDAKENQSRHVLVTDIWTARDLIKIADAA